MSFEQDDPIIDWLLSSDIPTIRYRTMIDLLGKNLLDHDVAEQRRLIMADGPVPIVLSKQSPNGHWGEEEDFYQRARYFGTCWNVYLLAQLDADGEDERIRSACEFMLRASQDRESGAFSYRGTTSSGGVKKGILPCLTANMLYSMAKFGYAKDERVVKAANWVADTMVYMPDGLKDKDWPYHYDKCWRKRTCRSLAVKWLRAINELTSALAPVDLREAKEECSSYILETCLGRDGSQPSTLCRPEWGRLGFPHIYDTDLLEIGHALVDSGIRGDQIDLLVDQIVAARNSEGKWRQDGQFIKKMAVTMERPGEQSKFVTMLSLSLLSKYKN